MWLVVVNSHLMGFRTDQWVYRTHNGDMAQTCDGIQRGYIAWSSGICRTDRWVWKWVWHPKNEVTRALEAPDKINIFSCSVSWIVQPSQCFVNIAICKMATKCHEDGRRNALSTVFTGDSARHYFQNFIFLTRFVLILILALPWPRAWTSLCRHCPFAKHIDMLG